MNIDKNKASTGIYQFRKEKPIIGFIFSDNTCPICDNKLELLVKSIAGFPIAIRYECKSCGYICPIKYEINGNKCTEKYCDELVHNPVYDKSIFKFRKEFGD